MIKHNVLVIEGAGAKIPLESAQIEYMEGALGVRVSAIFEMAATTSAGTVIMSALSPNRLDCKDFNAVMLGKRSDSDKNTDAILKWMFTPRGWLSVPRYDREVFVKYYNDCVGKGLKMSDAIIKFFCTSVNECDGMAHFFKSWEDKDGQLMMTEAACRSFAAPFFFGEMIDTPDRRIWADGGCGIYNLPLLETYAQIRANGWLEEGHETHILALCGGTSKYTVDFDTFKAEKAIPRIVHSLEWYFNLDKGGIAKAASTIQQINTLNFLCSTYKNLSFQYTNWWGMPKKLDAMDDWKSRWVYYDKGMQLANTIDLSKLRK